MVDINIYSTPSCPYCKQLKKFLKDNDFDFEEFNVAENRDKAEEMVKKSGQRGVPVTILEKDGEEQIVVGFDRDKLIEILEI